jgi:hypothetical protein
MENGIQIDYFPGGLIINLLVLLAFIYLIKKAYKSRICPKCKRKMERHYPKDSFVPDYYFCKKCNFKSDTDVRMADEYSP